MWEFENHVASLTAYPNPQCNCDFFLSVWLSQDPCRTCIHLRHHPARRMAHVWHVHWSGHFILTDSFFPDWVTSAAFTKAYKGVTKCTWVPATAMYYGFHCLPFLLTFFPGSERHVLKPTMSSSSFVFLTFTETGCKGDCNGPFTLHLTWQTLLPYYKEQRPFPMSPARAQKAIENLVMVTMAQDVIPRNDFLQLLPKQ